MDRILTFDRHGQFQWRVQSHGVYPDQAGDELSAWTEIRGTHEVDGDSLHFELRTRTWYDRFYEDPGPFTGDADGTLFGQATFVIRGDELVLRYLSYPADAPVQTIMRLKRL